MFDVAENPLGTDAFLPLLGWLVSLQTVLYINVDGTNMDRLQRSIPELKDSIGEGPNHSNFSDRSSVRILGIERKQVRILGIERKPRKTTSPKWHATQNTRRGHRKGKQTALRQRGGLRSRTNSNDAILAFKSCNACLHKRICLPSKYDRSALRSVERRIECID